MKLTLTRCSPASSPRSAGLPPHAAVTADEAKALGTTLTAVGAEKAGNKDGTIPAYTGGLTTPPAGFKAGDGIRPDPFAGEKPRLVDRRQEHGASTRDKLTEGTKALLQKYPTLPRRRLPDAPHRRLPEVRHRQHGEERGQRQDAERRPLDRRRARRLPVPDPEDRLRGDVEPPGALQRPGATRPSTAT